MFERMVSIAEEGCFDVVLGDSIIEERHDGKIEIRIVA